MSKRHLKRLAVPTTWNIQRKASKFVARPNGYLEHSMPVAVVMKEILCLSSGRSETKKIIRDGKVRVDGRIVKDDKLPVGLMAIISIDSVGDFRMLLNGHGYLFLKKTDSKEAGIKPCRIVSKKTLKKGKLQFGFHDGRTSVVEIKGLGVSDTVVFSVPDFKILKNLKLEKGAGVYITGGSNVGSTGVVESVSGSVTVRVGETVVQASKDNVFVIGEKIISVSEK